MKPATHSQRHFEETSLLVIHNGGATFVHSQVKNLRQFFRSGDLLVVNRSGTLPSSFHGILKRSQEALEIRLASFQGINVQDYRHWRAVSFGAGDWHLPTEQRGDAPFVQTGDVIEFSPTLTARVISQHQEFPRLIDIEFSGNDLLSQLYEKGRPIQYSYLQEELKTWDQQTLFATAPLSVEPPSAAFQFHWQLLSELENHGVQIAALLHGAGLSSTGDPQLDQLFPLDEYFEIPADTIQKVQATRLRGGRVIALGTTVTRALETAFRDPQNIIPRGRTQLKIDSQTPLQVIDSLLTGMHEEGTSHLGLMAAFGGPVKPLLEILEKETGSYRSHEYGDLTLLEKWRP